MLLLQLSPFRGAGRHPPSYIFCKVEDPFGVVPGKNAKQRNKCNVGKSKTQRICSKKSYKKCGHSKAWNEKQNIESIHKCSKKHNVCAQFLMHQPRNAIKEQCRPQRENVQFYKKCRCSAFEYCFYSRRLFLQSLTPYSQSVYPLLHFGCQRVDFISLGLETVLPTLE